MEGKKTTITDIAKLAGVSKTTVSFAFNDPSKISKEMYKKIMKISNDCGYIPNPVARTMTTKRIGSLGVLLPQNMERSFNNPYLSGLLQGMGSVCVENGMNVTIVTPYNDDLVWSVKHAAVDGFVAVGLEEHMGTFKALRDRHIPFVCLDVEAPEGIPCIVSDDEVSTYKMMDTVIKLGHRDIGILSFRPAMQYKEKHHSFIKHIRLSGYKKAMAEHTLSPGNSTVKIIECDCTEEGGKTAAMELFGDDWSPTVIVCMSDVIAAGVLHYCYDNNLSVPRDVSVCGFDDISLASLIRPGLTTVRQPIFEKGRKASRMLLDLIGKKKTELHVTFKTNIVVRESLGRPSGRGGV